MKKKDQYEEVISDDQQIIVGNQVQKPLSRLLRLREVEKIVGFKKSTLYKQIAKGEFPGPVKIGRSSRWVESAIHLLNQDRINASHKEK